MEPTLQYWIEHPMEIRWIPKNYPELWEKLLQIETKSTKITAKLWCYYHGLKKEPGCIVCGKPTEFHNFEHGFRPYCSYSCSNNSELTKDKYKQTCLERYGVENASSSKTVREKVKHTMDERYGGMLSGSPVIKEKMQKTMLERYGVDHYSKTKEYKNKHKKTMLERYGAVGFASPVIKEKMQKTMLERYGVEHNMYSEATKEKIRQTCLEKYGVENPFQSDRSKEKSKQTCLKKYGTEYASTSDDVKNKIKQTCLERFDAENYKQSQYAKDKALSDMQLKFPFIFGYNGDKKFCSCTHPDCNKCNEKQFTIDYDTLLYRNQNGLEICTKLNPEGNNHQDTSIELFVQNILKEHNINFEKQFVDIIPGCKIDIYIPSHKLAIECNGVYWHSSKKKYKKFHVDRMLACKKQGIQLIQIWEDWILNNPENVRGLIESKLGIYKYRIGASKCKIQKITSKQASEVTKFHIQGPCKAGVNYGLYYKGTLVSVMCFSKRKMNNKSLEWELVRYCCMPGWQIIHGAERMLTHFIRDYQPKEIISFSSNDISNGKLYELLGFKSNHDITLSYWYIDKQRKRHHRYSFTKSRLIKLGYDANKTETQITKEMGLLRIYDSGTIKWILKC